MKSTTTPSLKPITINLIKDHLKNTRLMDGLSELGFYSDHYQLNIADSIFKLIGIRRGEDELFETYLKWCSKIGKTDIFEDEKALETYAEEIYNALLMEVK